MAIPHEGQTLEALDCEADQGVRETETTTDTGEPTMNLTVYNAELNCHVLNPAAFPNIINAFHPDYVKTYHPELLSSIKSEEKQKENGKKVAKTTPMKMHIVRPKLEVTEFHVYQKAGMPKKGKKQ